MAKLPVDVLWIARYDYRAGWSLALHQHDYLQMILILDGKGEFMAGERTIPIRGGEWFLIRAGETHGLRARTLMRTLDVKFRVASGTLEKDLRSAALFLTSRDPGIATRLERIRAEGEHKPPFYRELCSVLLTEILFLYLRQDRRAAPEDSLPADDTGAAALASAHDQLLGRALAFIRSRYKQPLTVSAIAQAARCTDRTLRLHFQAALQTAPLAFLQRHRVAQAKALIQYSDYTLKEIAEQVGFQTVHHFTRHFKAIEGRSPAVWRRDYLEGVRKDVYINPQFENHIYTVESDIRI
jgi:AraC family L-rhamnose operon transcriptional activator RhaR